MLDSQLRAWLSLIETRHLQSLEADVSMFKASCTDTAQSVLTSMTSAALSADIYKGVLKI